MRVADWPWPLRRTARSAPTVQDNRLFFKLSPGESKHMVFEVPTVERVGSPSIDYEAELVTFRRCVHLLWTSEGRVSYWTSEITSKHGCNLDDDAIVEDYEEKLEKERKARKQRDVTTPLRGLERDSPKGLNAPTVIAAAHEYDKHYQPLPPLPSPPSPASSRSAAEETRRQTSLPSSGLHIASKNRTLKVNFDPQGNPNL